MLGRFDHLFELLHLRFRHPDLAAFLANVGGDVLHHVQLPALVILQIDLFRGQFAAAGLAGFFGLLQELCQLFFGFVVFCQGFVIIYNNERLNKLKKLDNNRGVDYYSL